jgi:hypothetical protein
VLEVIFQRTSSFTNHNMYSEDLPKTPLFFYPIKCLHASAGWLVGLPEFPDEGTII